MKNNTTDKLQLCRNCKNRKFDKATGIVCGLTGNKPTFDAECSDYVADEAAIEIDREREIELNSRESGIRGWLAFFIWVGVIGGAVGSVIIGIRLLTENTFGLAYSIVYGDYAGSSYADRCADLHRILQQKFQRCVVGKDIHCYDCVRWNILRNHMYAN